MRHWANGLRAVLNAREDELRVELNTHLRTPHEVAVGTQPEKLCKTCLLIEGAIAEVLRLKTRIV